MALHIPRSLEIQGPEDFLSKIFWNSAKSRAMARKTNKTIGIPSFFENSCCISKFLGCMMLLPQREHDMSYQIATSETGKLFVVLVADGRIVRILRECDDRADVAQLLRDLSGWNL
jgi:hypothetical protein